MPPARLASMSGGHPLFYFSAADAAFPGTGGDGMADRNVFDWLDGVRARPGMYVGGEGQLMGRRKVSEYGCFGTFFVCFMMVLGLVCTGYLGIALVSNREFQRDRREMQSKRDASEEYDRVKAVEAGPKRDAMLEAWKAKYPVQSRRMLDQKEAGHKDRGEDEAKR
jgi:hypothetical protein